MWSCGVFPLWPIAGLADAFKVKGKPGDGSHQHGTETPHAFVLLKNSSWSHK
jgi:hypothetical protein